MKASSGFDNKKLITIIMLNKVVISSCVSYCILLKDVAKCKLKTYTLSATDAR